MSSCAPMAARPLPGWPSSPRLEALRADWLRTDGLAEQQRIARDMQLQAFQDVPYIPLGQTISPSASAGRSAGRGRGAGRILERQAGMKSHAEGRDRYRRRPWHRPRLRAGAGAGGVGHRAWSTCWSRRWSRTRVETRGAGLVRACACRPTSAISYASGVGGRRRLMARFGRIDFLLNNAGKGNAGRHSRDNGGGVRPHHLGQPQELLQLHPRRGAAHAGRRGRPHRQHVVPQRPFRRRDGRIQPISRTRRPRPESWA